MAITTLLMSCVLTAALPFTEAQPVQETANTSLLGLASVGLGAESLATSGLTAQQARDLAEVLGGNVSSWLNATADSEPQARRDLRAAVERSDDAIRSACAAVEISNDLTRRLLSSRECVRAGLPASWSSRGGDAAARARLVRATVAERRARRLGIPLDASESQLLTSVRSDAAVVQAEALRDSRIAAMRNLLAP